MMSLKNVRKNFMTGGPPSARLMQTVIKNDTAEVLHLEERHELFKKMKDAVNMISAKARLTQIDALCSTINSCSFLAAAVELNGILGSKCITAPPQGVTLLPVTVLMPDDAPTFYGKWKYAAAVWVGEPRNGTIVLNWEMVKGYSPLYLGLVVYHEMSHANGGNELNAFTLETEIIKAIATPMYLTALRQLIDVFKRDTIKVGENRTSYPTIPNYMDYQEGLDELYGCPISSQEEGYSRSTIFWIHAGLEYIQETEATNPKIDMRKLAFVESICIK
jgi:hypothetical protein